MKLTGMWILSIVFGLSFIAWLVATIMEASPEVMKATDYIFWPLLLTLLVIVILKIRRKKQEEQ